MTHCPKKGTDGKSTRKPPLLRTGVDCVAVSSGSGPVRLQRTSLYSDGYALPMIFSGEPAGEARRKPHQDGKLSRDLGRLWVDQGPLNPHI